MNVHYKIRYTKGNERIDKFITLPPTPFGSSRIEQVWNHCITNNIHPNNVIILETTNVKDRISLTEAYKRWLLK